MESSVITHSCPSSSDCSRESPEEESGWTGYFYDFPKSSQTREKHDDHGEDSCLIKTTSSLSPSLVSDAASYYPLRIIKSGVNNSPKRLNFRKSRPTEVCHHDGDDLEDTASSPVNSPKVTEFVSNRMNGGALAKVRNLSGEPNQFTEVKKRGLCLVPVSTFVNCLR